MRSSSDIRLNRRLDFGRMVGLAHGQSIHYHACCRWTMLTGRYSRLHGNSTEAFAQCHGTYKSHCIIQGTCLFHFAACIGLAIHVISFSVNFLQSLSGNFVEDCQLFIYSIRCQTIISVFITCISSLNFWIKFGA